MSDTMYELQLEAEIRELKEKLSHSSYLAKDTALRAAQVELAGMPEKIAKAVEEGCPTFQWLKKPCFACVAAAERVRKCLA
jgi:hypothetical protein